jgi:hypothetical protein
MMIEVYLIVVCQVVESQVYETKVVGSTNDIEHSLMFDDTSRADVEWSDFEFGMNRVLPLTSSG